MEQELKKRRRPWIAALLSLSGIPLGQLYAGHPWRTLILFFVVNAFFPIIAISILWLHLPRTLGLAVWLVILSLPIYLAIDAFILARRKKPAELKTYQRWWVYLCVFFVSIFFGVLIQEGTKAFVAEAFIVPGMAMFPTVQHNDRVLVDKFNFNASSLKRNDVAVYWNPEPQPHSQLKRIMGLPGETVEIKDETLFIDGKPIPDVHAFFREKTRAELIPEMVNFGPLVVPENSYFVLGDNRRISLDSRLQGPIPFEQFIGLARAIYWSNDYKFARERSSARPPTPPKRGAIRWDRIGLRLDRASIDSTNTSSTSKRTQKMTKVENLDGDWQALTGVMAGESQPEEIVSATTLTINDTEYVVDLAGNLDRGNCYVDSDSDPTRMRIEGNQGPNEGKTFLAIVEFVNADEIKIAYDLSGTAYPTSFKTDSTPSNYVASFRRK